MASNTRFARSNCYNHCEGDRHDDYHHDEGHREFTREDFGSRIVDSRDEHRAQPRDDTHRGDRYGYSRYDGRRNYGYDRGYPRRDDRSYDRGYPRRDDRRDDRDYEKNPEKKDKRPEKAKSSGLMKSRPLPKEDLIEECPIEYVPKETAEPEKKTIISKIWSNEEIETEKARLNDVDKRIKLLCERIGKLKEEIAETSDTSDTEDKTEADILEHITQLKSEINTLESEMKTLLLQYRKDVEHFNVEKKRTAEEQQRLENEKRLLEAQERERIKAQEREKRRIRDEQREAAELERLQAEEVPNAKEEKKKRRAALVAARGGPSYNFIKL